MIQSSEHQTDDGGIAIDIGLPSLTPGAALQVNVTGKKDLGYGDAELKTI